MSASRCACWSEMNVVMRSRHRTRDGGHYTSPLALTLRYERPLERRRRQRVAAEVAQVAAQPDLVALAALEPRARRDQHRVSARRRARLAPLERQSELGLHGVPARPDQAHGLGGQLV